MTQTTTPAATMTVYEFRFPAYSDGSFEVVRVRCGHLNTAHYIMGVNYRGYDRGRVSADQTSPVDHASV